MISNEMEASDIGLLKKLQSQNLSEDMIARLFCDLLIAAVDTVSFLIFSQLQIFGTYFLRTLIINKPIFNLKYYCLSSNTKNT